MRKLLFVLVVLCISSAAFAQDWKFGGGLTFGSDMSVDGGTGVGLNIRGDYSIDDNWFIDPGFTFVFPSSKSGYGYDYKYSAYQFNVDAHYYFAEEGDFTFYGLAGLNYTHAKVKSDYDYDGLTGSAEASDSEIGLNLGFGANYKQFLGELKYDTSFDQLALTIGIMF